MQQKIHSESFYLGDEAYVRRTEFTGDIVIYTSDGACTTNSVYLGPTEISALIAFLRKNEFIPNRD